MPYSAITRYAIFELYSRLVLATSSAGVSFSPIPPSFRLDPKMHDLRIRDLRIHGLRIHGVKPNGLSGVKLGVVEYDTQTATIGFLYKEDFLSAFSS